MSGYFPCDCDEELAKRWAETGIEVCARPCPSVYVDTASFPAFVATCPHGVTWLSEPTGEQKMQWAKDRTP